MSKILFILIMFIVLSNAKELKGLFGYDNPPFIFSKNSSFGIEADLLNTIFSPLGFEIKTSEVVRFYLQTLLLKNKNYDFASSVPKKDNQLYYSEKFISYDFYAITRKKEHLKIDSILDLKNLDFVSWNNSYNELGEEFFKLFNPKNGKYKKRYHQNPSSIEDIRMFFEKKVDAILIDKRVFKWYKEYFNIKEKFEFHKIFPKEISYFVAFRDENLCKIFNERLKKIKEEGLYRKILDYYFSYESVPLIKFVDVLTEVIAPYLYKLDKETSKALLNIFIENKNIFSIEILDTNLNKTFLKVSKKDRSKPSKKIKKDILYQTETGIIKLGEIILEFRRDLKAKNILPDISKFYSIANINTDNIYKIYRENMALIEKKVNLTPKEQKYLDSLKFISVHNEKSWAPYNFNENGIPKGYVVDYIKLLGRKLNKKINFVSGYSWNEFLNLIKDNRIDVISNIIHTKSREKYINFTKPYLVIKKAIFSNQPNLRHLSDLEGKTVAIPKGFFIEEYLRSHYPKIKIKTYKNILDSIVAVLNKEADAVVESYNIVNYLLQKNNLTIKYMSISEDKGLSSNLCLGVSKAKPILRDILEKAIESVTKEELSKLKDKWKDIQKREITKFTEEEYKYLKSIKSINVCTDANEIPIDFKTKEIHQGISIDVLEIISNKLNKKLNFIQTKDLNESLKFLRSKECDLIPDAIELKSLEKDLCFTKPYLNYKLALITREEAPVITDIRNIGGRILVVKKGTLIVDLIKNKYPKLLLFEVESYKEVLDMIRDKRAYFTILPMPTLSYFKPHQDLDCLKVSGYLDTNYSLSMAVEKDNYLLYGILEKTLDSIPKNTFKIINDKWTTQKVIERIDYEFVIAVGVASFIIILIILFGYFKQKKLHDEINELNRTLENRVQEEIQKNRDKEKMLLYQDRLARMGEIISMIAHQWRQPLNNLSIIIQMLTFRYKKGELNDEVMNKFKKDATNQINLMSKTIDNFKDFFKPEKRPQKFNLNNLILDMLDLLKPIIENSKIIIDLNIKENITIYGYRNELGQSIFNIINNAKDALNSNKISEKIISIEVKSEDEKVFILIKDNAGGIPEEILDKIFDPYFSTKENKNGTGLGLYMSKIIIEEYMNGKIVASNGKDGAIFMIELPKLHKKG